MLTRIRYGTAFCVWLALLAPSVRAQGGIDFTRYVALGDGLTAGFQNGALHERSQWAAYPVLVAAATSSDFSVPLLTEPGIPSPNSVSGLGLKVPRPGTCFYGDFDLAVGVSLGRVDPAAKARNVAVPFQRLADATTVRWRLDGGQPVSFEDFVLGLPYGQTGELPPSTQLETAVALDPTFVTVWLGPTDALRALISGAVDASTLTPTGQFEERASVLFGTLGATSARGAILNVPDVTASPFLVSQRDLRRRTGLSSKQLKKKMGVLKSSFVPLTALPTVDAIADGDAAGPLAPSQILTKEELDRIRAAIAAYNHILAKQARVLGWALVDLNREYTSYSRNGVEVTGVGRLTTGYRGGLYDLDGIYPSDTGQALIALATISAINRTYGTALPLPDVAAVAAADPLTCAAERPIARLWSLVRLDDRFARAARRTDLRSRL